MAKQKIRRSDYLGSRSLPLLGWGEVRRERIRWVGLRPVVWEECRPEDLLFDSHNLPITVTQIPMLKVIKAREQTPPVLRLSPLQTRFKVSAVEQSSGLRA